MVKKYLAALVVAIMGLGAITQVSAAGFIFTDDRCRPGVDPKVVCIAAGTEKTVGELLRGNGFERFVQYNRKHLPADVTKDTVLPARVVYIRIIKS